MNQCRFAENSDPDIRPILPTETTRATPGPTPSDPAQERDSAGLSAGVIAAIVVGPVVFVAILGIISVIVWRRRVKGKVSRPSEPDQGSVEPELIDHMIEQELYEKKGKHELYASAGRYTARNVMKPSR